jgi:hypothetical protein
MFYQWRGAGFKSSLGAGVNIGKTVEKATMSISEFGRFGDQTVQEIKLAGADGTEASGHHLWRDPARSAGVRWDRRSGGWCWAIVRCKAMSMAALTSEPRSAVASTGSTPASPLDGRAYKGAGQ